MDQIKGMLLKAELLQDIVQNLIYVFTTYDSVCYDDVKHIWESEVLISRL